jgi:hypothetical protein
MIDWSERHDVIWESPSVKKIRLIIVLHDSVHFLWNAVSRPSKSAAPEVPRNSSPTSGRRERVRSSTVSSRRPSSSKQILSSSEIFEALLQEGMLYFILLIKVLRQANTFCFKMTITIKAGELCISHFMSLMTGNHTG